MADRLLAKIEYINKLAVDIDVGKFTDDQIFYEVNEVTDDFDAVLTKVFSEVVNVTDDVNGELEGDDTDLSITKVTSEIPAVGDVFERQVDYVRTAYYYEYNQIVGGMIDPDRFPEDEYQLVAIGDSPALTLSKTFSESISVSESFDYERQYGLADGLSVSDQFVWSGIYKSITDVAEGSDAISFSFDGSYADYLQVSQAFDIIPGKGNLDSTGASDVYTASFTKVITDEVFLTDNQIAFDVEDVLAEQAGVSEATSFVFSTQPDDNVTIGESVGLSVSKSHTDASSMTDSGYILGQSYCSLDYFEDDYVGLKRVF